MGKKGVSALKVAAAYIGTIVGAGFATGQEILQFFTRFGEMGLAGLTMAAIMFMMFGYIVMNLGRKLNARSHLEIIMYSGGRTLGGIIDLIITFFLFGSFTAMISGTGALFAQQFNLPRQTGNILMAVISAATVLTGINGVINSISLVVPFTLAAVMVTSIFSIAGTPPDITAAAGIGKSSLITNWFPAAILYVSYNTLTSVAVLGALGAEAQDGRAVKNGAILGGLGLGFGSLMIYLSLSCNIPEISRLEVPMAYIAGKISPAFQAAYSTVLIAEIYTTAVGSLYGFVSRIADMRKPSAESRVITAATVTTALLASQFGFSNLVKYLYPLEGYAGIILLICLARAGLYPKNPAKFKR